MVSEPSDTARTAAGAATGDTAGGVTGDTAGDTAGAAGPSLSPPGPGRFPITQLRRELRSCGFDLLYDERRLAAEGREDELLASVARRLRRRILAVLVAMPLLALSPFGTFRPWRLLHWPVWIGLLAWQSWGLWRVRRARAQGLDCQGLATDDSRDQV